MLKEENHAHSQHDQDQPAPTPLAAPGVRRRPIPTIQLSRATIASLILGIFAGMTFGVGVAQLRGWEAEEMTVAEGQRALADFISVAALGVLFALGAMVIWGTSVITTRIASGRRDRIRGEAALRQQVADVLAGQAAITARFLAVVDDVRRDVRVSRQPKTTPQRRRRRKSPAPTPTFDGIVDGSNVIQMPSAESMRAVAAIARKIGGRQPDGI